MTPAWGPGRSAGCASPERDAIWFEGTTTSHAGFAERVRRTAGALAGLGVRTGDRVAWTGGNHTAAYTQARSQALAQAADRHRVTATLLDTMPAPAGEAQNSLTPNRARATAVWTDPAGIEHRVSVSVPAEAKASGTVSVWVDRDGDRTTRPISEGDVVTGQAVGQGIVTFGGLSLIAFAAYC